MIYVLIAAVLGFAAWQLVQFARRTKQGRCAPGGCAGCGTSQSCSLVQIEETP
jgi:hypothetical protein